MLLQALSSNPGLKQGENTSTDRKRRIDLVLSENVFKSAIKKITRAFKSQFFNALSFKVKKIYFWFY